MRNAGSQIFECDASETGWLNIQTVAIGAADELPKMWNIESVADQQVADKRLDDGLTLERNLNG